MFYRGLNSSIDKEDYITCVYALCAAARKKFLENTCFKADS